jgi:hypothetical protein
MTDVTDEVNVILPAVESVQTEGETEARLNSDINSLWSAHQASKATVKHTKEELKTLRLDLGRKLSEMKSILVRTGRGGGWAAYLRSHDLPRASVERYINQHEALLSPETNRVTETISQPTEDDVRRLVRSLLPRLRRVLTTTGSVSLFVDEVIRQLQTPAGDLGGEVDGAGSVAEGDSGGPRATEVSQLTDAA